MNNIFFNALTIKNLLSFGSNPEKIPLKPLNVIIGPNGSGKSNLIEIILPGRKLQESWTCFKQHKKDTQNKAQNH